MFHINFGICIRSALLFVLFFMVPTLSSAQTQNYCLVFDGSEIVCVNSLAECVSYSKTLTQYGAVDCISGTTQNTIYPSPTNLYPKNPQTDATLILPTQQSTAKGTLEGTLSMDMDPEYPEPNESTSIKLSSTLVDLNRSEIFWYANNNIIASGTGKKEIEVEAGKLGSTTILSVIVKTNDGLRLNKEITIRPSELTLIWEAESYTPPFYKGKALLSPESSVRIVALPVFVANGANIPKETLVYIWRLNGKIVLSGVGETTLEVKGPKPYGNLDISLETSSPSGSIIKTTNIGIGVSSPEIIFYEDRPLEGINYNKALTNEFNLNAEEVKIQAEPYFFTDKGTALTWSLNGKNILSPQNRSLVLRNEGDGNNSGTSLLKISARNMVNTFQQAINKLFINFGNINITSFN